MASIEALRKQLETTGEAGARLLKGLSEADLARATANPEWTVRDLLVHLIISEPGLCGTIRAALEDNWVVPEDFDLNRWNQRQVERNQGLGLAELRERFTANRQATLALLGELQEADLAKQARHASLRVLTLAEFFEVIMSHQREHLGEVATALEAHR